MPCLSPYIFTNKRGEKIPLPCGKCPRCRKRKVNEWVFRMQQEDKVAKSSHFVTLTYDTDHVPIQPNGYMTLDKSDLQKFFKRLRKKGEIFKYYAVGEYGSKGMRPHYHIIFFGISNIQHIFDTWKLGNIHIGDVTGASIGYTTKYMDKLTKIPVHPNDTRLKEFSVMSKGIGKNFAENEYVKKHFTKNLANTFCYTEGGHKIPLPRYYRNIFLSEEQKKEQRRIIDKEVKLTDEKRRKAFKSKDGSDYDYILGLLQLAEWNKYVHNSKNRQKL